MTTENTHPEHNDWQAPGGEQLSAPESATPPTTLDAAPTEEQSPALESQPGATPVEASAESASSSSQRHADEQKVRSEQEHPQAEAQTPLDEPFSDVSELFVAEQPALLESEALPLFGLADAAQTPVSLEEAVRPFTDFIEEFRQTEVRLNALLQDQGSDFTALAIENTETATSLTPSENVSGEEKPAAEPEASSSEQVSTQTSQSEEIRPGLTQPTFAPERPVSPLLRPATRLRLPRHGRHRVEEHAKPAEAPAKPAETPAATAKPEGETKVESAPAVAAPQVEEQAARPARRYRFDRPAATASASPAIAKPAPTPVSAQSAETKEKRATSAEQKPSAEPVKAQATEVPAQKVSEPEAEPAEVQAPVAPTGERRKRGNHERQREKEHAAPAPAAPIVEAVAPEKELVPEVAVEDLPPLEYAELQAANSRRRRRRRMGTVGNGGTVADSYAPPKAIAPTTVPVAPVPTPASPAASVALPKSAPAAPVTPPIAQNYNIVSGYTVSQMNQGNDSAGPFMGPEPSPARGSTFTSTPQVRHARTETLRGATAHPVKHGESQLMSAASINHLGNIVAQAIQVQTDRMVSELRRANQVPTNISVALPPFPSNERVGVFVDVANLLYSARTLRMTVDFGKLLDFLRGNRRLVRAQAYCPTSPQPGDDQMFLQAVKGLGYRITTKNYKTFSSGAKKADLDLDLCMDVVRLVDGKAVDCIVLVSGDSDFMPMLDYCSDHGVRVEVAAFDESMSATLRQGCDLFVNLSMLEEIRA